MTEPLDPPGLFGLPDPSVVEDRMPCSTVPIDSLYPYSTAVIIDDPLRPPEVIDRKIAFDFAPGDDFTSCVEVLFLEGGCYEVQRAFRLYQGGKRDDT